MGGDEANARAFEALGLILERPRVQLLDGSQRPLLEELKGRFTVGATAGWKVAVGALEEPY